ncbi:MAG: hypothetical protein QNJ37_18120 [Crocosphaera sp.]|nr:hypothetical protein [Crocosphaera sp.]
MVTVAPPKIPKPSVKNGAVKFVRPGRSKPPGRRPPPPPPEDNEMCDPCLRQIQKSIHKNTNAINAINAGGQLIDLAILYRIDQKLGDQVPGGLSGWLKRFSQSIRFDRALNVLNTMLLIHNAAQLSRNLGDSLSYFINSGLNLVGIRDEDDTPIDINGLVGGFVSGTIKSIVGEQLYNGLSEGWKKTSAIYTATMQIYELTLNSLAGIAEGLEIMAQYTGKIGNALKRSGVILENAYEWMDENIRVKTGRLRTVQNVIDGIQNAEEVVSNLTEITEQVQETQENINEIKSQFETIKTTVKDNEDTKKTAEETGKTNSQSPDLQTSDLKTSI